MSKSLARTCCLTVVSATLQIILSACFVVLCLYLASVALTPVRILGITQLPPGIKYFDRQARF
tara:strand:+ start:1859 stop:2047 length:189 start_codon:yes stop_codon:yes gene_type:complete